MFATSATLLVSTCQHATQHERPAEERAIATARPAIATAAEKDDSLANAERKRFAPRIAARLSLVPDPPIADASNPAEVLALDNGTFRDRLMRLARTVADGQKVHCNVALPPSSRRASVVVSLYREGSLTGRGESSGDNLCVTLKDATRRALAADDGAGRPIEHARFVVELPEQDISTTEYAGRGVELTHGLVPQRQLSASVLNAQTALSEAYLLRVLDPARGGAHKFYHPSTDSFEGQLHTVYTASTALTLLKMYERRRDDRLLARARSAANFILSMQHRGGKGERARGGFFYSFDLARAEHDDTMVVGTAAKSIFTLVELHRLTHDPKYVEATTMAADWLIAMQRPDGSVTSSLRRLPGGMFRAVEKESLLYTGQLLSGLSRAYVATRRQPYLDAAAQTALYLSNRVSANGCYLGDDYRKPNPISSSWVVLSLLDFARASRDERAERLVLRCADDLLRRQVRGTDDVASEGRFKGALSSSGNGWLAEVMSEVFLYCRAQGLGGCERFRDSALSTARLLVQYTYSRENAFVAKNPDAALGGVFWSVRDRYVRTDAVCHATNAYLNLVDHAEGELRIAERPFAERPQVVDVEQTDEPDDEP